MKKYLLIALASLFAFASCTKESNETPEMNNDKNVVLSFTSKRPNLKSETKTAWDGTTVVWSAGDKARMGYTLDGHWMNKSAEADDPRFYASKAVTIDDSDPTIGTFVVEETLTDPGAGSYVFYGFFPRTANDNAQQSTAPEISLTIPTNQTPGASTFDGSADIMIGKSETLNLQGLPTDPVEITWSRIIAHADLTFKNLAFVGTEIINTITLTANEAITGTFTADLSTGTISSGTSQEVKISGMNLSASSNSVEAWCCILPVTITSLDVEVVTNKAKYTRSISGISKAFKKNARNKLAVNMASAVREELQEVEWVKKPLSQITSSDVFVIVGNNGSNYAMSNDKGASNPPTAVAVTVSGDKLTGAVPDNIQWNLSQTEDGYTFYPNGSTTTWLYCTSSNNGVRVGTNEAKTFKLDNGYLKHVGTSRYVGVYTASGATVAQDWRCYTSYTTGNIAGQTFAFYVKTTDGGDTPSVDDFTTVAELNALASSTATEYTGKLTNAVVSFVPNEQNAVIKDATGSVLLYKSNHNLLQGQTYTGDLTVKLVLYYGSSEITAIDAAFTGSSAVVAPEVLTLNDLVGNHATYQNAYVQVNDLEVTEINNKNVAVKNGSKTYYVYGSAGLPDNLAVGDIISVVGTVELRNENEAVKAWTVDAITITQAHTPSSYAVTFTQPSAGGSFTVKVNGSAITSGTEVLEGTVVTLTATPASGYNFTSWTVSGATVSGNTTTATFTMGTSAVNISAVFTSSSSGSVVYTLDGSITGGAGDQNYNSNYSTESEITQNGITWHVMGNTEINPWRIGGKSLTNEDRPVYSTNALNHSINKIEITHGNLSGLVVNSMTVLVSKDEDFTNVVSTFSPTFAANNSVIIEKPSGKDWSNCFYKIVYNVTVSSTSNKYLQLVKVEFTGE